MRNPAAIQGLASATNAVRITLDGREVEATPGERILAVAQREGITVPHLCHQDGLRAAGNCRACVVEIEGERFTRSVSVRIFWPACTVRQHDAASTRSPSISTTQARQLPAARRPS
jgi:formate dehydrogenase major subunit